MPYISAILSTDEYGIVSLFTSSLTILTILFGLNLKGGIRRYYFEHGETFRPMLGTNLIFSFIYSFFFMAVLFLLREPLAEYLGLPAEVYIFACIISAMNVYFDIYTTYLQGTQNSKSFAAITAVRSIGYLVIYLILISFLRNNKYWGSVYANIFIVFVVFAYSIWRLAKIAKFEFKAEYLKYALFFGIPLIPHSMSDYILSFFDRLVINDIEGASSTGIYTMAYQVGMIINLVVVASNRSWQPIFYKEMEAGNYKKINVTANKYANTIYALAILLILFTREAYTVLVDAKFNDGMQLVPIIIVSYVILLLYTYYSHYSLYNKKTFLISISTLTAGVANILLNYWLIPIFGYIAAAYTTLVSYLLLFILHYTSAKVLQKQKVIPLKYLLPNFFAMVVIVAGFMVIDNLELPYLALLPIKIVIAALCVYVFIFRKSAADGRDDG